MTASDNGLKLLYTAEEAGQVLGASRATIYRMIREGDLRAVISHGRRRIHRLDLEAYAQELRQMQSDPALRVRRGR